MTPELEQQLVQYVADWEDKLDWLTHGWDCIEEYTHGLGYRERIDELLDPVGGIAAAPETLRLRLATADARLRAMTIESGVCVWHTGITYRYHEGRIVPIADEYESQKQWYYYRWLPDHPYDIEGHDYYSYQKTKYGLDFRGMTQQQLAEAVSAYQTRLDELITQSSGRG